VAIGEKAEVAHAVEAVRQYVRQETPDELVRVKVHDLLTVATIATVILPSEGNMVVTDIDDAAVGYTGVRDSSTPATPEHCRRA